ncbi:MAG: DPP IV N-terminal domain-containing protein [Longimicrobiales bacterium]
MSIRYPACVTLRPGFAVVMLERIPVRPVLATIAMLAILPALASAQDRLKTMPGYDQFQSTRALAQAAQPTGGLNVTWAEDSRSFVYIQAGRQYRYDIRAETATDLGAQSDNGRGGRGGRDGPERGRQWDFADSHDGRLKAFYRDRNLWISNVDGSGEFAVTTEGDLDKRTKFGTGSWVYGEELGQNTAMWWSPDNAQLAYYGFDESPVQDYLLQLDQTQIQSTMDVEAYPKAGTDNPIVDLYVYDLTTKRSTRIDVRDGQPFSDDVVGHYVYNVEWTADGSELTIFRANRRQNIMEFAACSPGTGKCRIIVREEWPTGWVMNSPPMQYLEDGKRFLWISERNGYRNVYLYDLTGKLIAPLTNHEFEVGAIVNVDEKAGTIWYTARSGDNHMKMQLHRVGLNGKNDRRLTDPVYHHAITLAPDRKHFVDVAQTHDKPPFTNLLDANGRVVAELAKSDMTKFDQAGFQRVELFTFKAADGVTDLHGILSKPSNFDPTRKYPLLVTVYAGPATNGARETFAMPHPFTEYGFLVLSLDSRSAAGRGKRFLDAIYLKLGQVEVDDQAAGVKAIRERPYVDGNRVGIFGTSYGGYVSALAVLRYPDVFHAASAMSAVTDWRHYDTIYTERYMWTPQGNTEGYDLGAAMPYAENLRGDLIIYYGTADNNVHPSNSMQLIEALQEAGKSFQVQVGPDRGHTALNQDRMMEFFIESLVLRPANANTTS